MADRVACEHSERCGGCPAIELPYEEQLALKRGRVVQALARYPALELVYADPTIAADSVTDYRTRAKLMVDQRGAIGLFAKGGGHEVVDVPKCRVLAPVLARVAEVVRARVKRDVASGGPLAPDGAGGGLRAIDVRELDGTTSRALVTLIVHRGKAGDLTSLRSVAAELIAEMPEIAGVAASLHDGDSPQVLGAETIRLAGDGAAEDRIGECVQIATFGSFVQAHRGQAARIHEIIGKHLGVARSGSAPVRVLDLYAGSGAIALALASRGAEVTCVEAFGPAAARIEEAARKTNLEVHSVHSDVASALRAMPVDPAPFDAVVVNPPRRGVGPAAREALARLAAPVVAYVSCDPDTLTRDLDHFARLGYRCASAQPLDMIPLSDEVETIAILRRAPMPPARVLYEDDTVLFVEKAPHEPIATHEDYVDSLTARVRRLPNASEAVSLQKLDVGTSGVVVFARTPAHVAAWDAAISSSESRRVLLTATRGVLPSKGTVARDATRTKYRRLAVFAGHCVARVMADGRARHVRRHLAAIGHPVLGDDRFGHAPSNRYFEEKFGLDRTFLHSVRFEVDVPVTKARLVVESQLPGDLVAVLERAGGPGTLRFLDQKNALGRTSSNPPPPSSLREDSAMSGSDGRLVRADIVSEEDDPRD